jgi:hypothetical protein
MHQVLAGAQSHSSALLCTLLAVLVDRSRSRHPRRLSALRCGFVDVPVKALHRACRRQRFVLVVFVDRRLVVDGQARRWAGVALGGKAALAAGTRRWDSVGGEIVVLVHGWKLVGWSSPRVKPRRRRRLSSSWSSSYESPAWRWHRVSQRHLLRSRR